MKSCAGKPFFPVFFRPLPFWFRPNRPGQQLLSHYPSAAADDDEEEEEEDDALQLWMNPQSMARCWTAARWTHWHFTVLCLGWLWLWISYIFYGYCRRYHGLPKVSRPVLNSGLNGNGLNVWCGRRGTARCGAERCGAARRTESGIYRDSRVPSFNVKNRLHYVLTAFYTWRGDSGVKQWRSVLDGVVVQMYCTLTDWGCKHVSDGLELICFSAFTLYFT